MKKRLLSVVVCIMVAGMLFVGCAQPTLAPIASETPVEATNETAPSGTEASEEPGSENAGEGLKIGATIQDLGQFWSEVMKQIETRSVENGDTFTYVSCEDTSSKQIEQIENFISSGCDVILVHPSDPDAIEAVTKEAMAKGVKVMCWDNVMTNSDLNWVIDNVALGRMVAEEASKFITEKYGDKEVEVAVLGYPQTEVLLEREQGILEGLKELAPNAKIVANQPALDTTAALTATETILQANPNLKIVCTVGCVRSLGANEAMKAQGITGEDVGIFGVDGTNEEMEAMLKDEPIRMSTMITGTAKTCGDVVYDMLVDLGNGVKVEERNVYRDIFPVTKENANEYLGK